MILKKASFGDIHPGQQGVVTLSGYGISVRIDRGHLLVEDGIGSDRHRARFPRVGHGLKRLVVIGSDGMVSLAALRWLADQDAAFVMLERDGTVLVTTGPVRPSDARLRRAQALAGESDTAMRITRDLIGQKLDGQERVAREQLLNTATAQTISRFRSGLANAETPEAIRLLESQAGYAYWSAWRNIRIDFPKNDLRRVPEHWRSFGARMSPLSGSPRLAVNPANATLNYLYAILESEARLAAATMGLDPGLGVLHADRPNRDSLACDLMEPVRPKVDAYVLDWITRQPLRRDWFFEQRNGNCRLMDAFAIQLSQTARTWARAVAPIVERMARTLLDRISKFGQNSDPATRLTQSHRRQARGSGAARLFTKPAPRPSSVCRACGMPIEASRKHCASCTVTVSRNNLIRVARTGRVAAQSAAAQAMRSNSQRRHEVSKKKWLPGSLPGWLNKITYEQQIRSQLGRVPCAAIASALGVSLPYAADIRAGRRSPHPRHWMALADLASVSAP